MPFTTYELWPPDSGYVVQVVHNDDGTESRSMQPTASAPAAVANFASLITKAQNALNTNQTFLAIPSPTNAQAVTQVQALSRQMDGIIYYLLQAITGLSTIPGT